MLALLLSLALTAQARIASPWVDVAPGVQTTGAAELAADPNWAARVVLVDPARATFAVRFDAARPTLQEWRARYPDALAILNGAFYSLEGNAAKPTCDAIAAGKPLRGVGCHRQDALWFAARPRPPEAIPANTASRPPEPPRLFVPADFHPEAWGEALKSFPALVRSGAPACTGPHYCAEASRTSAVAQLKDGRILLFASQWPAVRRAVGQWLAEELGAVEALNLDGGPEAALALRGQPPEDVIGNSGVGLPMVLLVLPR